MGKKSLNRLFVFALIGIFAISLLMSVELVCANELTDQLGEWWSENIDGWDSFGIVMTYIIGALLIGAFVSSIMGMFFPKKYSWAGSLLGFLFGVGIVMIIKPYEIFAVLLSFKSIGLSLLTVIPLAILAFFSIRANINNNAPQIFLGKLIWIVYIIYIIAEGVIAGFSGRLGSDWSIFSMPIVILVVNVLVALGFIFARMDAVIADMFLKERGNVTVRAGKKWSTRFATLGKALDDVKEGLEEGAN